MRGRRGRGFSLLEAGLVVRLWSECHRRRLLLPMLRAWKARRGIRWRGKRLGLDSRRGRRREIGGRRRRGGRFRGGCE